MTFDEWWKQMKPECDEVKEHFQEAWQTAFRDGYEKGVAAFHEAVLMEREACAGFDFWQSLAYARLGRMRDTMAPEDVASWATEEPPGRLVRATDEDAERGVQRRTRESLKRARRFHASACNVGFGVANNGEQDMTRLQNGHYQTAAGSEMWISGEYGGVSRVAFAWMEEGACFDCVPDAYEYGGMLVWHCEQCGGGQADLLPVTPNVQGNRPPRDHVAGE